MVVMSVDDFEFALLAAALAGVGLTLMVVGLIGLVRAWRLASARTAQRTAQPPRERD